MITNLACNYCGRNDTAREELIEVSCVAVLEFAAENFVTNEDQLKDGKRLLTMQLIKSKEFHLEIYSILKNKVRDYAKSMSERSNVFPVLYPEKCKKKISTVFFGDFAENANEEGHTFEYCTEQIPDKRSEDDMEMAELLIDLSRFITEEELNILKMRLYGVTLKEIAKSLGMSISAVNQRISKIARKLKPFYESLKSAA